MSASLLKITAVITTYNRRNLLKRAIKSVLRQNRPPQQILVIDDGSVDGTGEVVQTEFPEIEYIYQDNAGISAARNRGIQTARHPWIAFLDSDDEWKENKLKQQESVLIESPSYRICHTDEIWIRRGRRVNPRNKHRKSGGDIFVNCLPLCVISPSSVMIHRDLFDRYGFFDEKIPVCEDYDMWLRFCAQQHVLYIDKKLIIKYGGHEDQLSRRYWGMDRFRIYSLEKILKSGLLTQKQQYATLCELEKKIRIYISGAQKRGKNDEIESLAARYKQVVSLIQESKSRPDIN